MKFSQREPINLYAREADLPVWAQSDPWWERSVGRRAIKDLYLLALALVTVRAPDMIAASWKVLVETFTTTISLPLAQQAFVRFALLCMSVVGAWAIIATLGWAAEMGPAF